MQMSARSAGVSFTEAAVPGATASLLAQCIGGAARSLRFRYFSCNRVGLASAGIRDRDLDRGSGRGGEPVNGRLHVALKHDVVREGNGERKLV